ncbi:trans-L-3-hydroxyproline dehydratase-like [Tubulanus polymorphus]|uniref:trans-L-3-hydroxyproline dehydratase-like n=1 Tax=Tubulanus polymorphus TaxID=672921 RepID=UPI003DA569A4
MEITTSEMHTGGEALRIIETGFPKIVGKSILEKRRYAKENLEHLRKFLMYEPRGHKDMYGAVLVEPDLKEADVGVLFMHNEGYSTMCGHAIIALGRYVVDKGIVKPIVGQSETQVNIQCPCGLVRAHVEMIDGDKTGRVRFHSIPAFTFATDVKINVPRYGEVAVDIAYGGAFYAFIDAQKLDLDVRTSNCQDLTNAASAVTEAAKTQVKLLHPDDQDLAFLYGTILTDGKDEFTDEPTANVCIFADREVDRSPTGSGVTARIALQYQKKLIPVGKTRRFINGLTGSEFTGKVVNETSCGSFPAVVVEVAGNAFYSGKSAFIKEDNDEFGNGFLIR